MNRHDSFHSTAVAWLKIALPLLALAILSTLFLVARTVDPSDAIPYSEVDIEDRVREPRLTQPRWAGVTDDGAALTIDADEARPGQDAAQGPSVNALIAELQTPDGGTAKLVAAHGVLDPSNDTLTVEGGVTITTSTGYELQTEAMIAKLDRTSIISQTRVEGVAPAGHITAGAMEITQQGEGSEQYLLVFKDGVRLLYTPPKQ